MWTCFLEYIADKLSFLHRDEGDISVAKMKAAEEALEKVILSPCCHVSIHSAQRITLHFCDKHDSCEYKSDVNEYLEFIVIFIEWSG